MTTLRSLLIVSCIAWSLPAQAETPKPKNQKPNPEAAGDASKPKRYAPGPDLEVQAGVPQGKLEGPFLFHSKVIENTTRKYWIFVPSQYTPENPACVLVFQDGARAINPAGVLRVPNVLNNLIARKEIPVTIGIFVTPGERGEEYPDSIGLKNPNNRSVEYDSLGDAYPRMIVDELLPEVGKRYKLRQDASGRAIGGASSGGIAAFTVAWERPKEFRNVISLIGSFTNLRGGHVYPELVAQAPNKGLRVFLQDGIFDNRNPDDLTKDWYLQNEAMAGALLSQKYDLLYVTGEGGHSDDHGGALLPCALQWIWRDEPGVVKPKVDPAVAAKLLRPGGAHEQMSQPKPKK
ncbi:alpha/beta hydrolase [Planctomicrobium piriforme]|uniref:Enterochelin esterase n=1 Tax=Planctomicrobium piriforme TaxID=1576369 RepID=A0A1I3J8C7_9PLAN|nr:alpha/beta hydrolase-fold protein [Planctomicrobium piriforme]SFI56574.1 enterochelin esterase [Planctomicrobium piriforme]